RATTITCGVTTPLGDVQLVLARSSRSSRAEYATLYSCGFLTINAPAERETRLCSSLVCSAGDSVELGDALAVISGVALGVASSAACALNSAQQNSDAKIKERSMMWFSLTASSASASRLCSHVHRGQLRIDIR